jgi:hypothetical protein
MASRELRKQGEKRRRFEAERRDCHQSRKLERRLANGGHKLPDLTDSAAAFLRLFADIDLDIDRWGPVRFPGLVNQPVQKRGAVDRVDRVEQFHRFCRLIRLQPSDAMQPDVRIARDQRRPFFRGFLDPTFAEVALASSDQFFDLLRGAFLADGDQRDLTRIASGEPRRYGNTVENDFSAVGGGNQNLKAVPTYTAWLSRRSSLSADARSRSIS